MFDGTIRLIERYDYALAAGALVTLKLSAIVWLGGFVLGTVVGVLRASVRSRTGSGAASIAALAAASIPILVYLLWAYYPLQQLLRWQVSPFTTAAAVFTAYNVLVVSSLIYGGINELPLAYSMAARVSGIPRLSYVRVILLPLAVRRILPAYLASQVNALHLTLFASLISVEELFRVTQRINSIEYDPVSAYSLLALFYFALSFPLFLASRWAERRLAREGLDR
jgi:ABC-type amino acid transport system permease subunit